MRDLAAKIIDEYNFAKSQGFDSVSIVIESESGTYNVEEYNIDNPDGGLISDSFDCIYEDIEEISEALSGIITGEVYDIRIE